MMLVGMAHQAGRLPISTDALEAAIRLNGAAVDKNLAAFRAGRVLAETPEALLAALPSPDADARGEDMNLGDRIAFLARELTAYQDEAYARRFLSAIDTMRAADEARGAGAMRLTRTAAEMLYKVMAYKDEYEVARLYSDPAFKAKLAAQFADPRKLKVMLAPPLISREADPKTGRPKKIAFGSWIFSAFGVLAGLKGLRGGAFDVFGRTAERRAERALVRSYLADLSTLADRVGTANYGLLVEIARVPDLVRGFGPVKEANLKKAEAKREQLMARLGDASPEGSALEAAE